MSCCSCSERTVPSSETTFGLKPSLILFWRFMEMGPMTQMTYLNMQRIREFTQTSQSELTHRKSVQRQGENQ